MKYIKTYEIKKSNEDEPKVGDYITCSFDDLYINFEINSFLTKNIGQIYSIIKTKDKIIVIYDKIPPPKIIMYFTKITGYYKDKYTIPISKRNIILKSDDKSEIESIIKYNL